MPRPSKGRCRRSPDGDSVRRWRPRWCAPECARRRPSPTRTSRCARAVERLDVDRDHDVGAEFLRLNERAGGERLAGDAGRKAKVVFDPSAGPGLAAERACIKHRDRQALRGGVNRRRQAGGPAADHRDVVNEVRSRRASSSRSAATAPSPADCRAPSRPDRPPAATHRRYPRNGRSPLWLRVSGRIEHVMRIAFRVRKPCSRIRSPNAGAPISTVRRRPPATG